MNVRLKAYHHKQQLHTEMLKSLLNSRTFFAFHQFALCWGAAFENR